MRLRQHNTQHRNIFLQPQCEVFYGAMKDCKKHKEMIENGLKILVIVCLKVNAKSKIFSYFYEIFNLYVLYTNPEHIS